MTGSSMTPETIKAVIGENCESNAIIKSRMAGCQAFGLYRDQTEDTKPAAAAPGAIIARLTEELGDPMARLRPAFKDVADPQSPTRITPSFDLKLTT